MFAPAVLAPYLPPGQHAPGLPMPPYAAPGIPAGPVTTLLAGAPRTGPYVPAVCRSGAAGNVAVEETTVAAAEVHAVATFTADAPDMAPWETVSSEIVMQDPSPQPSVVSPLAAAAPIESVSATAPGTLPWIDAFLRSTPTMPMRAVEAQGEAAVEMADVATEQAEAFEVGAALEAPPAEANPAEVLGSATVDLERDADDLDSPAWMPQSSAQPASEQPEVALPAVVEVEETVPEGMAEAPESIDIPKAVDTPVAVDAPDATTELWPLADAAAAFHDLSARLDQRLATAHEEAPMASAASAEPALAPWADDDFMDVMPVSVSAMAPEIRAAAAPSGVAVSTGFATDAATDTDGQSEHVDVADAALIAHEPIDVYGGATVSVSANVAVVLEQLARRMRAGELTVPSYDAGLGEQAALVAALAAVLGVRSL